MSPGSKMAALVLALARYLGVTGCMALGIIGVVTATDWAAAAYTWLTGRPPA